MVRLTKEQQKSLLNLYLRGGSGTSTYIAFRRKVTPYIGDDCILVPWCGMWVGIEKDGYTHS